MIKSKIYDGSGNNTAACVIDNALVVTQAPFPPTVGSRIRLVNQPFMDAAGNEDMNIDGATTPTNFYVQAGNGSNLYITKIVVTVGYGTSGELFEFADGGAALTNGIFVHYDDGLGGEVEIVNAKSNLSFQRSALQSSNTNWEARGFAALNDYGYFVAINLSEAMPPYGIELDAGTNQRLVATIRDDLSVTVDLLQMRAIGFERFI